MKIKDFSEFIFLILMLSFIIVAIPNVLKKTVKLNYKSPLEVKTVTSDPVKVPEIQIKNINNSVRQQLIANFAKSEISEKDESKKVKIKDSAIAFNLNMIIISETGRIAYVNNILVREGDILEGYMVEKIAEKGVLLSSAEEKIWLQ